MNDPVRQRNARRLWEAAGPGVKLRESLVSYIFEHIVGHGVSPFSAAELFAIVKAVGVGPWSDLEQFEQDLDLLVEQEYLRAKHLH